MSGFKRPALASAPHASSTGTDGTGKAACSAAIQQNSTRYPWRIKNWIVALMPGCVCREAHNREGA